MSELQGLLIICGHGAGDSGACGHGYQEAERVRTLGKRIKDLGGDKVMLGDVNRNYYRDNGISSLNLPKGWQIIELHTDSEKTGKARGGHVIIKAGFKADTYDKELAELMAKVFPGRSKTIVERSDLANPNRAAQKGYGYRLLECGFISNAEDVKIFNDNLDDLARSILSCFGIKPGQATPPTQKPIRKTVEQLAREVVDGKWGVNPERKRKLEAQGYDYAAVQRRVNEILRGKPVQKPTPPKPSQYYPGYAGHSIYVDEVLKAIGVPEKCRGSYKKRKVIAEKNGITSYAGTAAQNNKLISLAKQGRLKRV